MSNATPPKLPTSTFAIAGFICGVFTFILVATCAT
jgi:hypothetical protein